ncbi:MAG: (2Fe-2S)-binding protein [Treponema sp.]|jgi:NADH dehydrogenase/NADH:ubiquinone oxidoreductase subunit G|nr:(2Fe-2S)-binding protein [Treponema sp.]
MSHHKPDPNINVNLTIDGQPVTVPEGTRILEAAKKANIHIPTLCDHPDLCKRAVCRVCVVECDGRGKLAAACANDVWEGVNIVTNNQRLLAIRKTIVELILANHPQECLTCIRNTKCELQSLAESFGIRASVFSRSTDNKPPVIESEVLVRDMEKCVKCGRCVEACQEVQTIRAINSSCRSHKYEICTPYKQSLSEGPCVFCGQCAAVCPVGAIYEHDQTADVWASLNDSGRSDHSRVVGQVSPRLADALNEEFGFAEGTITTGKIVTVLKQLGFDQVFDAKIAVAQAEQAQNDEVQARIKNNGKLPMITGCSAGVVNFVKYFYPDLTAHLYTGKRPRQIFADSIKTEYSKTVGIDPAKVTSVSLTPCLAAKYQQGTSDKTDMALTAGELARMIKLAGIQISALPESPFSASVAAPSNQNSSVKKATIHGFADARKVMEAIRKGECDAQWVEIVSCPADKKN